MASPAEVVARRVNGDRGVEAVQTVEAGSGVSWGAIFVGAAAAAVLSLLLVMLGFGLGLSSISPWANVGAAASTMGIAAVVWIAFTQLASAGLGGYLAGRLRVRWTQLHTDEVYFRDTAHGFLAWAVATLFVFAFLGTAVTGILEETGKVAAAGAGAVTGTAAAAAGGGAAANSDALKGWVDRLYRRAPNNTNATPPNPASAADHEEALRILAADLKADALPDDDRQYLAQVIAQDTGISQEEAVARVNDVYQKAKAAEQSAKQAADTARKAAAHASLWTFVALLIGAFVASLSATLGGRRRDLH
ncbi:MAG: hypothetical protein JO022_20230 [Acidobacteriaceae bacterium]|nr:hypothetical protein [Acidobacteriaceae bacterium]